MPVYPRCEVRVKCDKCDDFYIIENADYTNGDLSNDEMEILNYLGYSIILIDSPTYAPVYEILCR